MNMTCDLYRNSGEPWGFRLQGGSEYRAQLGVKKVTDGGPAARTLRAMDEIITINNVPTKNMTHKEAEQMIKNSGDSLSLTIKRGDNPLAHYRPEGPIKFNVQRAQAAQQAMGVSLSPTSPLSGAYPSMSTNYSSINGYTSGPQMVNGYDGQPMMNGYPADNNNIYRQQNQTQEIHYTSYY